MNQGIYEPKGSLELCLIENRYIDGCSIDYKLTEHKASKEELIKYFTKI